MPEPRTVADDYQTISKIIENQPLKAISATFITPDGTHTTNVRLLWPHVLGTSHVTTPNGTSDVPMVLCYQYDDGLNPTEVVTPHPARENYRCFRLDRLEGIQKIPFDPTPTPVNWPVKFKFKHVKKQNCVDDPDVFR